VYVVENEFDLSSLEKIHWYVNEPNDLKYVRCIYEAFSFDRFFTLQDIIGLVNKRPEIESLYDRLFG